MIRLYTTSITFGLFTIFGKYYGTVFSVVTNIQNKFLVQEQEAKNNLMQRKKMYCESSKTYQRYNVRLKNA